MKPVHLIAGEAGVDAMLREHGEAIVIDGVAGLCLSDEREEQQLAGARGSIAVRVATVKSRDFPRLRLLFYPACPRSEPRVELGRAGYRAWRLVLLGEGALTELHLRGDAA